MSRTPARFTQADIARAIRAAQQEGACEVRVDREGNIIINISPQSTAPSDSPPVVPRREIVL
jgi:putative aminopeptidase FrvX